MPGLSPEFIQSFANRRVVVLGDLMLDRYISGRVRRISPEAPVPVVDVERTYERPGGAANVAANLRSLGAATTVIGLVGADPDGDRLREVLQAAGLPLASLVSVSDYATTVKTRVIAHGQQIVRVDREDPRLVESDQSARIIDTFRHVDASDVVVLSDYAKGVLSPPVCAEIIRICRQRGIPVVVDPKGRDYRRYAGATAVTPNQEEAAQALGVDNPSQVCLADARDFFIGELALDAALITQGEHGLTLILPTGLPLAFPATARDVADVTGAGDTVVSVFALGIAGGASFADAAFLANAAAGLVVEKAGAAAISPAELIAALPPRAAAQAPRSR